MQNNRDLVLSQYANSPTILALLDAINSAIDPGAAINSFYDSVWNVATATGHGLDIWGRIVGIDRSLTLPLLGNHFGFAGMPQAKSFGQAPYYSGIESTQTVLLGDEAFRLLILFKAAANIAATNIPTLNRLLRSLFGVRCYVTDPGGMEMIFVFEAVLTVTQKAILKAPNILPHPAGVGTQAIEAHPGGYFGFAGMPQAKGFGLAPMWGGFL